MSAFDKALAELLGLEGGLVDDPLGGRTNLGVTQARLDEARAKHPDWNLPEKVDDLTPDPVRPIYREYWDGVCGDKLQPALASCVFKQAVNQGPARAIIELQASLNVAVDGDLGPVTVAAANRKPPVDAVVDFISAAIVNYTRDAGWPGNGRGWVRRAVRTAMQATV